MTIADERAARLAAAIQKKRATRQPSSVEIPSRPEDQPARIGPMQRSLWLAHHLAPDAPDYHLADAYRVSEPLDLGRLQVALRQVVGRHRLLRSTFVSTPNGVEQRPASIPLEAFLVEDFDIPVGGSESAVAIAERLACAPFDLNRGPLVRLFRIGDLIVLVLHHILADERSLGHLWTELSEAYAGLPLGPPPPVQYDDFIAWIRNRDRSPNEETLEFWRQRLVPAPAPLRLPFPVPRPERSGGRLLTQAPGGEVAEGVRRLATVTGTTPFLVCAFAYRQLIDRLNQGTAPGIATPVSTRSHAGVSTMIGYFTNPVLLPTALEDDLTIRSGLRRFGDTTREHLAKSQVAFADLVDTFDPPRQADRHPVFQTFFVYRQPGRPPDFGTTRLEPVTLDLGVSKFDLTLFVTEQGDQLETALEYRRSRYDARAARRLLDLYSTLLTSMVALDPDVSLRSISIVPDEEAERLAAFSRGPSLGAGLPLVPRQIHQALAARSRGDAIVFKGETVAASVLVVWAASVARDLQAAGVAPGDRVGLFLERSPALIAAALGCLQTGAAYVPLDPAYPPVRNRGILDDAQVRAVLTSSQLMPSLPERAWTVVRCEPPPGDNEFPRASVESLENLDPKDPAYLLYTSGSSGRPKGVVVTHDNLRHSNAARLQLYSTAYGVQPRRFLLIPSIAFDSSVAGLFWALTSGGTLVLPTDDEARDPRLLVELVARERVDSLLCVPSLYAQMLRILREHSGDPLSCLEVVIVAGETCPRNLVAEHLRLRPRGRLFNEYGPTEATVWASVDEITAPDSTASRSVGPVSIGRPIPGVRIDLLDASDRLVPIGVPGFAVISGPTVAEGYWQRPKLTVERFSESAGDRRYRTGDRMAWTDEGRLLFLGRADDQIKVRGVRIEPGEIETIVQAWPEVGAAAVVGRTRTTATEADPDRLVLFVDGAAPAGWRQRLAEHLPLAMRPSEIIVLPELPHLPNGKVDRRALRSLPLELAPSEASPDDDSVAKGEVPTTLELVLLSLWRGLLGVQRIDLDDNFFELGGHSLLVAEMTLAIEEDLGVRLAASDLFAHPTVRELALRLEGTEKHQVYEHLFPLQPSGSGAPFLVAIPHVFADLFADRFRGERPVYGLRGVSLRVEGNFGRWPTLRDLAEDLANEICHRFPEDTDSNPGRGLYLAGYSFGASMAAETAHVLESRGVSVLGLYLITPMPLNIYRLGPMRLRIRGLRGPVAALTLSEAVAYRLRDYNPLTLRPYRYLWRWLQNQPRRRILGWIGRARRRLGLPLSPAILNADVRVDRFRLHKLYQPRAVRAPTTLFNAEVNALEPGTDAAATWAEHFVGQLKVVPIPDPHRDEAAITAARQILLHHLPGTDPDP